MPVLHLVAALAVEVESSGAICVSVVCRSITRAAHRTSSSAAMHAARVLDDAGGDADAAGAARLARAVADVDAALARAPSITARDAVAGAHQHEVRVALPVRQPEPIAARR